MTRRRVTAEFEADLYKVPKPRFFRVEKGELERKTYADGEERLEVRFHGIDVPEGTRVSGLSSAGPATRRPIAAPPEPESPRLSDPPDR